MDIIEQANRAAITPIIRPMIVKAMAHRLVGKSVERQEALIQRFITITFERHQSNELLQKLEDDYKN